MKGFFPDLKKQEKISKRPGRLDCNYCGLHAKCRSPKMEPTGEGKRGIFILAEAPGFEEDKLGVQLIGAAGQTLRKSLSRFGIDLDKDCRKMNAVNCRPTDKEGNNRTPTPHEIDCCRQRVWKEIKEFKPKLLVLLGNEACQSIYGHRWKKDFPGIKALRGWSIPDRELQCWVCPTFHPSFVLRSEKQHTVLQTFENDIKGILRTLDTPFPNFQDEKKLVECYTNPDQINEQLRNILLNPPKLLYMDYEASGLKLQAEGHFIKTVSFCWDDPYTNKEKCIAFLYSEEVRPYLVRILKSGKIKKGAHNFSYEEQCSRAFLNTHINRMQWDSALTTHFLDNRSKIVSLKFQVFVNFGVVDYASHLDEFILTSDKKSGNAFNRINEAPLDDLLIYNGLDSLYGKRLLQIQEKALPKMKKGYGYDLFLDGQKTLNDTEDAGVNIDEGYCESQIKSATRKIEYLEKEILKFDEVKLWKKKEGARFKLSSTDQLRNLLYNDLKLEVRKYTKKANPSVDKDVLDLMSVEVPFVKMLIDIKELKTARETYLKGWLRESVNGKMRPMYSLINVTSYRGSASKPNVQNVPNRDEEKKKMLRRAIVPDPGCLIMSADFKQIEVRVAACYTKDTKLIEYCKDPSTDMHRDMAMELFFLSKDNMNKKVRHLAKNGFVFPEFYGDYYEQVAKAMWDEMTKRNLMVNENISLRQHLNEKGIIKYTDFEYHVQKVEESFWKKRFKEYDQWKLQTYNDYLRKGYVDSLTGFRYTGPLERKHITNYPIQGSSFHCLLWSITRLNQIRKDMSLKSQIIFQIHDDQVWNVYPEEKEIVADLIKEVCTVELPKHFNWIIVPMGVDIEASDVNQSWYHKKPLGV